MYQVGVWRGPKWELLGEPDPVYNRVCGKFVTQASQGERVLLLELNPDNNNYHRVLLAVGGFSPYNMLKVLFTE